MREGEAATRGNTSSKSFSDSFWGSSAREQEPAAAEDSKSLRHRLRELLTSIGSAQSDLSMYDREFISERERLFTELSRAKADRDIGLSESHRIYVSSLDRLRTERLSSIESIRRSFCCAEVSPSSVREKASSCRSQSDSAATKSDISDQSVESDIYAGSISNLFSVSSNLHNEIDELKASYYEDVSNRKSELLSLSASAEEIELFYRREIDSVGISMSSLDREYDNSANSLRRESLSSESSARDTLKSLREKSSSLRTEIRTLETDFRRKLSDAERVAEKLKSALLACNMRKSQSLDLERHRRDSYRRLLGESSVLSSKLSCLQASVDRERAKSFRLRGDLNSSIGPRRCSSVLL